MSEALKDIISYTKKEKVSENKRSCRIKWHML